MAVNYEQSLLRPNDRVLSTLKADGSRRWLYPRVAPGRFLTRRRIVAYLLIAIFTAIPYIPINGKPAMLLDIAHRRFTFFGITFLPTDTLLLALFMVSVVLSIFFMTALFGRVWCGWACPQTVYMEFVYRPIERLFTGRSGIGGKPKSTPAWRLAGMYAAFLVVSLYLAHTFLAYFVGVEQLRYWIAGSPAEHPAAFAVMVVTTAMMMFDFTFFREQTCIIACPYGRFQSVLMDRQSLIISYDRKRGEPRAKIRMKDEGGRMKKEDGGQSSSSFILHPSSFPLGHCIDCEICVQVCPTGIDIRDGLQIECIGCAQCIDACDAVMAKIKRPLGLIRYSSTTAMEGQPQRVLRPRVVIYMVIVVGLLSLLTVFIATKEPVDVTLLRSLGRPYVMTEAGEVENVLRMKLTNRTDKPMRLRFGVVDQPAVRAVATQDVVELKPSQTWTEPLQIIAPQSAFTLGAMDVKIRVMTDDGVVIDRPCRLLGPFSTPVSKGAGNAKP